MRNTNNTSEIEASFSKNFKRRSNNFSTFSRSKRASAGKCNSFSDLIRSIDSLGISPSLYIEKSTKFQTVRGGILTLLLFIFGLTTFFVLGRDLYLRKSPFIVISKNFQTEPSHNLTENDFFAAALIYDTGRLIKDLDRRVDVYFSYLMYDANNIFPNSGTIADRKRIELVKCNESKKVQDNFLDIQSKLLANQSYYWCMNDTLKESLDGRFGSSKFNVLQFRVDICKNTTENNNRCLPEKQIREEMSLMFLHFFYTNSFLDGLNYTQPTNYLLQAEQLRGSSLAYRRDYLYYKKVEFNSDSNWVLEGYEKEKSLQVDSLTSDIVSDSSTKIFYAITITLSQIMEVYTRKYIKIQEIAASVGGIFKFFQQFFFFFILITSKNDYVKTVVLNAFKFDKVLSNDEEKNESKAMNTNQKNINLENNDGFHNKKINNYLKTEGNNKGNLSAINKSKNVNRNKANANSKLRNSLTNNYSNNIGSSNAIFKAYEENSEIKESQNNFITKNIDFSVDEVNLSQINKRNLKIKTDNTLGENRSSIVNDNYLSQNKFTFNENTNENKTPNLRNAKTKEKEKDAQALKENQEANLNIIKYIYRTEENLKDKENIDSKYHYEENNLDNGVNNKEFKSEYFRKIADFASLNTTLSKTLFSCCYNKKKKYNKDIKFFNNLNSFLESYLDIKKLIRTYLKIHLIKKKVNLNDLDVFSYQNNHLEKILK